MPPSLLLLGLPPLLLHKGLLGLQRISRIHAFSLQMRVFGVGDAGFEPATAAVWRQRDSLLQVSGGCKTAADSWVGVLSLFSTS